MSAPLSNTDWLLVVLGASKAGRLTPVQIQKSLFLLYKEAPKHVGQNFYRFEPYDYGPFSATIYRDLEDLAKGGAIAIESEPMQRWPKYAITAAGRVRAEAAKKKLDPKASAFVQRVVDWVTSKSFPELVSAIYARYPEFKANSVFNR
jgi:DNA-binding PadR family transcriptional regulator